MYFFDILNRICWVGIDKTFQTREPTCPTRSATNAHPQLCHRNSTASCLRTHLCRKSRLKWSRLFSWRTVNQVWWTVLGLPTMRSTQYNAYSLSLSTPCDADVANLFRALVLFLRFGVASWSSIMMCIMLFGAFCVFRRDPKKTSTVDPGVHTHLNTHSAVLHSQRLCCPCWQWWASLPRMFQGFLACHTYAYHRPLCHQSASKPSPFNVFQPFLAGWSGCHLDGPVVWSLWSASGWSSKLHLGWPSSPIATSTHWSLLPHLGLGFDYLSVVSDCDAHPTLLLSFGCNSAQSAFVSAA